MTDPSVLNATGLARTEALKVRLSREEEAEIRRRATALGVSAAAYARSAALGRRTAVWGRASIAGMEERLKAAGRLGQDLRDAPAGRRWSNKADADSAGRPAERKRLLPFAQARDDDDGLRKAGRRRQGWTAFGGFAQLYISLAER
jgi:hypothetical protein